MNMLKPIDLENLSIQRNQYISPESFPEEVWDIVDKEEALGLPALQMKQLRFFVALFHPDSEAFGDLEAAASYVVLKTRMPAEARRIAHRTLSNPYLAKWVEKLKLSDGTIMKLSEQQRWLTDVVKGREKAETVTKHGIEELEFPATSRLKALEILAKTQGTLRDKKEIDLNVNAGVPVWDVSKLTDQELAYLEYLQKKAAGEECQPPFALVKDV